MGSACGGSLLQILLALPITSKETEQVIPVLQHLVFQSYLWVEFKVRKCQNFARQTMLNKHMGHLETPPLKDLWSAITEE